MAQMEYNFLVREETSPNFTKYFALEKRRDNGPWENVFKWRGDISVLATEISLCNTCTPRAEYHIKSEDFHNDDESERIKKGIFKLGKNHCVVREPNRDERLELISNIERLSKR